MICITLCACAIAVLHEQWMSRFNSKNFSFTCLPSFFTGLKHVYFSFSANQERTGRIQSVGLYVHGSNEICAPFCTSPNCSADSYTVLIDLDLAELHNVLAESGIL